MSQFSPWHSYIADSQAASQSEEEFQRLMQSPPATMRLFGGPIQTGEPSCPPSIAFAGMRQASPVPVPSANFPPPKAGPSQATTGVDYPTTGADKATTEPTKPKRKMSKKSAAKGGKKVKPPADSSDDEGEDANGSNRWADPEVIQLISFKAEMDENFERNAKKQGMNMWEKLQSKMIVTCENFSKSAEACRKKWKYVYRQYSTDKRILQISGEGRKIKCKFFDEIDMGFNNRANVRKLAHGDAHGTPNPCPIDLTEVQEGQGPNEGGQTPSQSGTPNEGSVVSDPASRATKSPKSHGEFVHSLMTDMVAHTGKIASTMQENNKVFVFMSRQMERLIDKL